MEVSLCGGAEWRRRVCAVLSAVFSDYGGAGAFHGVCSGPCQPEKSGKSIPGSGKTRSKVAFTWLCGYGRQLYAYDVLYNRGRLDAVLFLRLFCRTVSGKGCRTGWRSLWGHAGFTGNQCILDGSRGGSWNLYLLHGTSKGSGENYQVDDDRTFVFDDCDGSSGTDFGRRTEGAEILSVPGFSENV